MIFELPIDTGKKEKIKEAKCEKFFKDYMHEMYLLSRRRAQIVSWLWNYFLVQS